MKKHPHQRYIDGIRQNNRKTIRAIYQQFFPSIEKYILKHGGQLDDVLDAFQEGMEILYHEAIEKNLQIQSDLGSWLFIVCRNAWFKKLRKKSKISVTNDFEKHQLSDHTDIIASIEAYEQQQLFDRKFLELSEACQKILKLFFQELDMKTIAKKTGYKNSDSAKKKKYQCQKRLIGLIQNDPLYGELSNL